MILRDTGDYVDTLTGTNARALDSNGNTIIVSASHEAIKDWGWKKIFEIASQNYSLGNIEPNTAPPRIRVTK